MDPSDPSRHSAPSSAARFDEADRRPRDATEKPFQEGYAMATTASATPAHAPYRPVHHAPPPPSSYAPSYPSADTRRTSDDSESTSTHRQSLQSDMSLPPIREALGPSTPLSASSDAREAIRALPPPHSFSSRPPPAEPLPSFSSSTRSTLSARANVPPPLPITERHPSATQSYNGGRDREADYRQAAEPPPPPHPSSGGYSQYPPPPHVPPSQHGPPIYSQPGQRPPGQLPLPSFPPVSPRQPSSATLSPLGPGRPPPFHPDDEYARGKHEGPPGRPLDAYPYTDALSKIAVASRLIFNFAEVFDAAAREPNGGAPLPSRVPSEGEIDMMMENTENIHNCLVELKSMIQHNSRQQNERRRDMAREAGMRRPMEEEEMHMYHDPSKGPQHQQLLQHHPQHPHHPMHHQPPYPLANEVKKRRGVSLEPPGPSAAPRHTDPPRKRAAPPGRCHSCNRVDTPEWRRGPDGARTLCNACGLHYAKLERKRQSEQRSIRPKPSHDP